MLTGLDRLPSLSDLVKRLSTERVGLLAHPASVNRRYVHAIDVLAELGIRPEILFGPEHGWAGHAQDMVGVGDGKAAGTRIVSLYGDRFEDLSPKPAHLQGLGTVIIDLQDVGSRYYTFVWTAVLVARACRDAGVKVLVLDRPNPLGGDVLEGRLQEEGFLSFVGLERVPIRHALTIGEIVAARAAMEGYADIVEVVRCEGTGDAVWVMPSPNMPTRDTALVYPGGCLIEGTNLSEGRGTTRPFELVGAPWLDGRRLADALNAADLAGERPFRARAVTFQPMFQKHGGKECGGVQIHPTDATAFRSVAVYVALVALAHHAHPQDFRFRTERYEFVDDIPAFDLLTGSARARERILAGDDPIAIAHEVAAVGEGERAAVAEWRAAATKVAHR
jgi:uncharacterized protein YbbC (DUF1343 family)